MSETVEQLIRRCELALEILASTSITANNYCVNPQNNTSDIRISDGKYQLQIINTKRLTSLIKAEQRFLIHLLNSSSNNNNNESDNTKKAACSNLPFLESVAKIASQCAQTCPPQTVVTVLQKIPFYSTTAIDTSLSALSLNPISISSTNVAMMPVPSKVFVDVSLGGRNCFPVWIKVRAGTLRSTRFEIDYNEVDSSSNNDSESSNENRAAVDELLLKNTSKSPTAASTLFDASSSRIIQQARTLVTAASQSPLHFQIPKIVYCFVGESVAAAQTPQAPSIDHTLDMLLINALKDAGVFVCLGLQSLTSFMDSNLQPHRQVEYATELITQNLNLDLTTLISLVSDTCHRFSVIPKSAFKGVDALMIQEAGETKAPLLADLYPLFENRVLFTTRIAFTKFVGIVSKIGGEYEHIRALLLFDRTRMHKQDLLLLDTLASSTTTTATWASTLKTVKSASLHGILVAKVGVVDDAPSQRFLNFIATKPNPAVETPLQSPSSSLFIARSPKQKAQKLARQQNMARLKLSQINAIVFGTADSLACTTVTANSALVRSFEQNLKGVSVYLHTPRSLIETRHGGVIILG
ncbi:hypothetical protein HK100_004120 [Physocladia obscura]|uniref:DUF1308 domain-containing protein n=1 Tax=Physocladia obscura TaxID=109957 RepID=A0AAD5XA28_9FUNG|nr:hypothetical protein HK100_004120 [Physocladia obscura]